MSIEKVKAGGVFTVQCFDSEGNLKWEDKKHNLVVNEGLQFMNDKFFKGSSYTAAWYFGLYGAAASNDPAAGDTMASTLAGLKSRRTRSPPAHKPTSVPLPRPILR